MKYFFSLSAHHVPMTACLDRFIALGILCTCLLGFPLLARGQTDFGGTLRWTHGDRTLSSGDTGHFQWQGTWLHLDAPAAGSSALDRRANLGEVWMVGGTVHFAFNPSSANFVEVKGHSEGRGSSWVLSLGETEDGLSLYREQGSEKVLLCRSPVGLLDRAESTLHWQVAHGRDRRYTLTWWIDGEPPGAVLSLPDSLGAPIRRLMWACRYTATRTDKIRIGPTWWQGKSETQDPEGAVRWHWTEVHSKVAPLLPGDSPATAFLEGVLEAPFPMRWDGWELQVNQRRWPLPSVWIFPGIPVVFGDMALEPLIPPGVLWIPVALDLPQAAAVALFDQEDHRVAPLSYAASQHRPPEKALGGYSLEPPHPSQSCLPALWHSSRDPRGASLGELPEGPPYEYMPGPPCLRVEMRPGAQQALRVDWRHPIEPSTLPSSTGGTWLHLEPETSYWMPSQAPQPGLMQTVPVPESACDCAGAALGLGKLRWGWPRPPKPFELVLTEFLEDPLPYEPRFVEIHNRTSDVLEAGGLFLSDAASGGLWRRLGEAGTFLLPNEVLAWSEDPRVTSQRYPRGDSVQIRRAFHALFPLGDPLFLGLFRSDGLLLDALESAPAASASIAEGLSWTRTPAQTWVVSGDSASPGRWDIQDDEVDGIGRVWLTQRSWSFAERPALAYRFEEEGAWHIRERWLALRGGQTGPWEVGPVVERQGSWWCTLPVPPGPDWLWEIEWTSPSGKIRRRAFALRMRE